MTTTAAKTVAPYHAFARIYDAVTGDAMLPQIWGGFVGSCRRHGIRFRSAADLGCGTGSFLACLLGHDRRLYGVDRSSAMLALARDRLRGAGVTLLRQDLKDLRLPEAVDLVTCNGATLNYAANVAELGSILRSIHDNTAFGGWLFFDIILNDGRPAGDGRTIQKIRLPGTSARWAIDIDPSGRGSVVDMTTRLRRADGGWNVFRETHRQRWFEFADVSRVLHSKQWNLLGTQRLNGGVSGRDNGGWRQLVARRH